MAGFSAPPIVGDRTLNPVPDPLQSYARIVGLRSAMQEQQQRALQMQMQQQQFRDMNALTQAFRSWDPSKQSYDDLAKSAINYGASGNAALGIQQHALQIRNVASQIAERDATTGSKNLETIINRHDQILGALDAAKQVPDGQLGQHVMATAQRLAQQGILNDPAIAQNVQRIVQLPPDQMRQQLDMFEKSLVGQKQQFANAEREAKLPGERAESLMKQQEAALSPMERALKNGSALEYYAAQGDPTAQAALQKKIQVALASRPNVNVFTPNDAKDIADAIENGDQPPTLQGLYRNAGPVRAELARRGVPIAKMEMDWKATQKFIATLNGPQQLRIRQSIESGEGMLDKIEGLYAEWKQLAPVSGFRIGNKAALLAMKQLPGRAGAVAQALDTQIADLTADLGNVYMGGNTPTDQALKLASKNLSEDWGPQQFEEGLRQARANLRIRGNSIKHSVPIGVSGETSYFPAPNLSPGAGQQPVGGTVAEPTATGPNGHKIVFRGGRWVDAQTGAPVQ